MKGTTSEPAEELWFWVEQRFQRCIEVFVLNTGFSP
jgi:hypothetical protein